MVIPRPSPLFLFLFFGLCLLNARLASARLYPTCPVQGTVYYSRKCDPITWKDDEKSPNMRDMGLISVDLYMGEKFIYTIDQTYADAGSIMFCPPSPEDFDWPKNSESNFFTIRFKGDGENCTVYTHDFRISGISSLDATSLNTFSEFVQAPGTSTLTASSSIATATSSTSTLNHQRPSGYDTSSTTVYADPLPGSGKDGKVDINRAHHKYHGGAFSWKAMDTEKMKFRFVFIVWPALIGICMAL
ncbi:hypothetical protein GYMLUDRAFT_83847 [Collybiopsis luxurians FD-317 M1]|uniref:Unplaced genomic scaffold GYMLUscaffold_16, whole genome shotgun sequence n=1 Tax=Collybiopsis luxurians FD-317 M1 TaxID=944289 RepID=A0A0D0BH39_9AGAR|nr:hypothetical protein GYMLUDRAFT_83847 [Collybiopsis luxurians FD-317 M1]